MHTLIMAAMVAATVASSAQRTAGDTSCITMNTERLPLAQRASPLDSLSFALGDGAVKICFGRPSARGREIFGRLVPYDQIWRTGANEPTMIHTTLPLDIAGIKVTPGSYSLYTVPHRGQWELVVNRSISQWGHERSYTGAVRTAEVGRAPVSAERTQDYVEQLTFRVVPGNANAAVVVLAWERTEVMIPIMKG